MKSILIYEREWWFGKKRKEMAIGTYEEIDGMIKSKVLMSDKRVIYIEHGINDINIY